MSLTAIFNKDEVDVMNKVHSCELKVRKAILDNNLNDELKQEYLTATYNYVLIQHILFPKFYKVACPEDIAQKRAEKAWVSLLKEMKQ